MIVDLDTNIILPNSYLCNMLGFSKRQIIHTRLTDYIHHEHAALFTRLFGQLVKSEKEYFQADIHFLTQEAKPLWAHLNMNLFGYFAAEPKYAFGIIEDISHNMKKNEELKNAKNSAEEATKVKSEFLANMSHEIRTPIHTVIGMGELLADTNLDAEQTEYAAQIQFSADVLLSLVNNILDFSKIEAGKFSLEVIEFDPARMAEEAVDLVSLEAHGKGLEIITWNCPDLPFTVKGDPLRIRQIIINLIKNAVKFTRQGEILLTVKPVHFSESRVIVKFSIKDTGIGIPSEKTNELFTSFTQVDSSTTRKYGGTGLGLSICKDLTEIMGGKIGLESQPGKGSTFWFVLPLSLPEQENNLIADKIKEVANLKVLIVDDNKSVQKTLRSYLTAWNCENTGVLNGKDALIKLREASQNSRPYDLALIDARMPGMDGWQLGGEISSDKSINSTKLHFPTGGQIGVFVNGMAQEEISRGE